MKRLSSLIVLLAFCGCSLMGSREPAKVDFDFGPPGTRASDAPAPLRVKVEVYAITAPAWLDRSSMYYRLAYANAATPIPYARSEWIMSPAALVTQRLRSRLADSGAAEVRWVSAGAPPAYALRSELVEFEQIFDEPGHSRGVLRLTATLEGNGVWAQRTFVIERPAPTADGAGGAAALRQCSEELTTSIVEWISAESLNAGASLTRIH